MVREQEPSRMPLMPSQAKTSGPTSSGDKKEPIEIISSPVTTALNPNQVLSPQPEFGRPTALGFTASPLSKVSATQQDVKKIRRSGDSSQGMFAKKRPGDPGYHKPPTSIGNPLSNLGRNPPTSGTTNTTDPFSTSSTYRVSDSAYHAHQNLQHNPIASLAPSNDPFAIPRPSNSRPPKYQTFSSNSNTNPYFRPAPDYVDLTLPMPNPTDDDEFNDAQVFGNDRSGKSEPTMFMDSRQADEDIKALLEGAMDDEDQKPRTRRKKKELDAKVEDLTKKMQGMDVKAEAQPADEEEVEEHDDGTREGLKVTLLPHQIDGVNWMIAKERSNKKYKGILPHGGILADDMGLGKTIQSIALILGNPRPSDEEIKAAKKKQKINPDDIVLPDRATLVVAPLALIKQWEAEIKDRITQDHALKVKVHHGPQRSKSCKDLRQYDVVITTYQTLSSEHDGSGSSEKSALFGVNWYRIILDEAHSIKNRNAKSSKAACALNAEYRWCLTGTPLQNNLDELQSLIHFLRIKPYDNLEVWRDQITKPMNNGRGGLSIRRLRTFLGAFMKRRTKDVLKENGGLDAATDESKKEGKSGFKLVKRTVENVEAEFNDQERAFYDRLEARTDKSLELMMAGNQANYASVLVLLMRLRQACNHPRLLGADLSKEQDLMPGARTPGRKTPKEDDVDDIAAMLGGLSVETKRCDVCQIELSKHDIQEALVRCAECEEDLKLAESSMRKSKRKEKKSQVKKERKVNRRVIVDSDDEEDAEIIHESETEEEQEEELSTEEESEDEFESASRALKPSPASSTKIRHLLKILKHDSHTNKYIVFSFFTSMLDLIEPFLKRHSLKFVRYDGAMRNDAREASLEQLRSNPNVRVLLCSLRAGSLGLNLTAASRVVVLEPFWNPFVEEQAIDRVHRLNQTQDVIVHKLTIKDTVEERILELQEKKRELAKATIEGQKGAGAAKLSMQEMLKLFKHDAEHDAKLDMIGMKDGRSLLDRDSQSTRNATQVYDAPRQHGRQNPYLSNAVKRTEDPVYGRRW